MEIESSPSHSRVYAFKVIAPQNLERARTMIENSCETCGHPFLNAADMCPRCIEELDKSIPTFTAALQDHLSPRWIHSQIHGYVDPWSREGRRLLDD